MGKNKGFFVIDLVVIPDCLAGCYATYQVKKEDNTLIPQEEGKGYYWLGLSNVYRDFLTT